MNERQPSPASQPAPMDQAPAQTQVPSQAQAQTQAQDQDQTQTQDQDQAQAQTYETASARVEEIIRRLDSGEASLNETLELVGEGKALIELCARELEAVSGALEELRLDELVARLERETPA